MKNFINLNGNKIPLTDEQVAKIQKSFGIGQTKLSEVAVGDTFKIGEYEFIKVRNKHGITTAVTKDIVFSSEFGANNNFSESEILKKLKKDILPKIIEEVGSENVVSFETDLTTLDGLKPYAPLQSKISLPTFDFYRNNVEIFDEYKLNKYWWLSTPDTANPHYEPNLITCVSPSGRIGKDDYYGNSGVRPILKFVSSISVSCIDNIN